MRICDLTTLYGEGAGGGVNTYLYEKARYLAQDPRVESHDVIVPGRRNARARLFHSTIHTIKSPALPWDRDQRVLFNHRRVRKLLAQVVPSVVEVDCAYLLGRVAASALRHKRVPVLGFYHVHLPTFIARASVQRFGATIGNWIERLAWIYTRHCVRPLDRILVSSPDIRVRLQEQGIERLEFAPLGVNLELFGSSRRSPRAGAPKRILYVGRLSHEKNLGVLLRAFAWLEQRGDYELHFVGDGPLRKSLERKTRANSRVSFLGLLPYGEALARVYAGADVLANPSPNETFSLSILEAFASGLPVVAVRRGGPLNLVTRPLGDLARPHDAADFARKIECVLHDPPRPEQCRRYVEENHSFDRRFRHLLDIYAQLDRAPATGTVPARSARAPIPGNSAPRNGLPASVSRRP